MIREGDFYKISNQLAIPSVIKAAMTNCIKNETAQRGYYAGRV
jgi:hypothetical protein